ncbi:hypothetical protein ACIRP3_43620 [Streptomyces sp. NPDC101209]|uniref:hypothetical protein n=1 Tax=Streptomyces sp. NPDC101209 TaxID=3366129 RepID=UPI00380D5F0B
MVKRRGLRKYRWFQLTLSIFLIAMIARLAFAEGDRMAQAVQAITLIFAAYVLGYALGFRSATRSRPEAAGDPSKG